VINGEPVGKTPVQNYTVSRDSDAVIEVSLDGYLPVKRTTTRVLSVLGKADLLDGVCVLIPLIGLASPASQEHSPDQYTFILEPDTQAGESE
jgi:hypothetical protein